MRESMKLNRMRFVRELVEEIDVEDETPTDAEEHDMDRMMRELHEQLEEGVDELRSSGAET